MESFKQWFSQDIPVGWGELLVRTVKVFAVAFLVLQLKEFIDAGSFDTPATALDSLYIAAGTLVLNAILMRLWPSPQSSQHQRDDAPMTAK